MISYILVKVRCTISSLANVSLQVKIKPLVRNHITSLRLFLLERPACAGRFDPRCTRKDASALYFSYGYYK